MAETLEWDDTPRKRNAAGQRYTHSVRDGCMTHKCYAPWWGLRRVAEAYTNPYDGTDITIVVEHLRSGQHARFAWHTKEKYTSG